VAHEVPKVLLPNEGFAWRKNKKDGRPCLSSLQNFLWS